MKIKMWQIGAAALAAVMIAGGVLAGIHFSAEKTEPGAEYTYESSLRWYETVDGVVLDGSMEDAIWQGKNPYSKTTNVANRAEKYKSMESRIRECGASVRTAFGQDGLFIYAETDDPVVNTRVVSPLSKSAFEFYLCSQDKVGKIGNIFEFTISADNCLKLRVRDYHPETGAEAWVAVPCTGVKSVAALREQGYSIECFIPWQTLNVAQKPEKLQMATALIRVLHPEDTTDFLWECFDYYTAEVALNNSATFPLFDENGYIPRENGDTFRAVNSNIMDLTTDTGDAPYVTALNRSPVTAFAKQEPVEDVYWESTVTIKDFNPNDDPRVGIVLRGEAKEDGSYDQVYLMLELDRKHEGPGYTLLHALMLPSSSAANNWQAAQRYVLGSHMENDSFKLAVMKRGGVFSFFIDDVLVASRSVVEGFAADTKVSCGITSWFTGAEFSGYRVVTEDLDRALEGKKLTFEADEKKWKLYFDLFTQDQGYLTTSETDAWMYHSVANWAGVRAGRFYAETDVQISGSHVDGNGYAGFVLTAGENRLYVMLTGTEDGLKYVEYHSMTGENFKTKVCESWDTVKLGSKNKLSIFRDGNTLTVLLNGKLMERIRLDKLTYPISGDVQVGLTGWKVDATFSGYSLQTGGSVKAPAYDKDSSTKTHGDYTVDISQSASKELYAQATLSVTDALTNVYPRAGLRLTNKSGKNIDFVVYYNKNKALQSWVMVAPTDDEGVDSGAKQYYAIDSALGDVSGKGIKLAVVKKGDQLYFYVNDVLLGAKSYSGFGAGDAVTAKLYSKYARTDFSSYKVRTDVSAAMAGMKNAWIADSLRDSCCFDVLGYANDAKPQITIKETCTYAQSSVLQWNNVYSDRIYAETGITLNNAGNAYAGMVLTDTKGNRFYVMTYGTSGGITYLEYLTIPGDDFDKRTSTYDRLTVAGGNFCKLAIRKDGGDLLVYADGTLVKELTLPEALAGETMVGLSAWKGAEAVYTDYKVLFGENYPEIQEPPFVGDASHADNAEHVFALHETAYKNLKAYTTLSVQDVKEGVYPRVGLRLTNAAGATLDYVIAYSNTGAFWPDGFYIVTLDDGGNEVKPWISVNAGILPDDQDVALRVEKQGDELRFYMGDTLVHTGSFAGFGAEDAVIAALYSRYTETGFESYGGEELIIPEEPKGDHSQKDNSEHVYALNETAYKDLKAYTTLSVQAVKEGVYARSGLRLTNAAGRTLDYVIAYSNAGAFWADGFYVITVGAENKESTTWVALEDGILPDDRDVILKVEKQGAVLNFYMGDTLVHSGSFAGFGAEDEVVAALYSRYTETVFADHGAEQTITRSDKDVFDDVQTLNGAAYKDLKVYTTLSVKDIKAGVFSRSGLRLTNAAGRTLDYVIAYSNTGTFWPDGFYIVTLDGEGREKTSWVNVDTGILPDDQDVTLKIEKQGAVLNFYIGDTLVHTGSFEGFGGEDAVTAALYSRYTETEYDDYGAQESRRYQTQKNALNDVHVLNGTAYKNLDASTTLSVQSVKEGVYARAGLRLTNAAGRTLDYVIAHNNNGSFWPNGFYIVTLDGEGREKTTWVNVDTGILPDDQDVTLRVEKQGAVLNFYMGDTLVHTGSFAGFGAADAATAALYSRYAEAVHEDYSVILS